MRQSVDSADQRKNSPAAEFYQILGRRTDDTVSYEESDLELDAFPDRQPVKFIADGGRNAVELRNTQDQPRSRVQDGLKSVEKISIRPRKGHRYNDRLGL